jgi:hypothetical protein
MKEISNADCERENKTVMDLHSVYEKCLECNGCTKVYDREASEKKCCKP